MIVTIRAAEAEDRHQWQQLYYAYANFYQVPMNQTILDAVWAWIHDDKQAFFCTIAKNAQAEAVGFMHYREMLSPLSGSKDGFLDDLFVEETARGRGVVGALFNELNTQAKLHGWPLVSWMTADDNYRARTVYDKLAKKTLWNNYEMQIK